MSSAKCTRKGNVRNHILDHMLTRCEQTGGKSSPNTGTDLHLPQRTAKGRILFNERLERECLGTRPTATVERSDFIARTYVPAFGGAASNGASTRKKGEPPCLATQCKHGPAVGRYFCVSCGKTIDIKKAFGEPGVGKLKICYHKKMEKSGEVIPGTECGGVVLSRIKCSLCGKYHADRANGVDFLDQMVADAAKFQVSQLVKV